MPGLALSSVPTGLEYLWVITKASKIIPVVIFWLMMPFSLVTGFVGPVAHYRLHKNILWSALSLMRPVSHPISLISTLILSHIRLGLPSDFLPKLHLYCPSF
jgi:hypothetical protein